MDFRQILNIAKRWIWLLVLGALVAGTVGYFYSNRQTPMYQASTRFVVLRPATTSWDYFSYVDSQQLFSTYSQLLTTDAFLEQASEELGFRVFPGQASATQISDTQFVRLTVTDNDPEKAALIANTLITILIEQNIELQSVRFETTERNLQNRADDALAQIESIKAQISSITDSDLETQLEMVNAQIDDLQPQVADLQRRVANFNPDFATDAEITQDLINQSELEQLKALLALYQEIYTELIVIRQPRRQGDSVSSEQEQLQRTLNLYEQIYFSSLSSLESLNLTRVQSIHNVVQVELAYPPRTPISPRPQQDAMLYAAVGLLGTGGIAFLFEYLDDTIKTQVDVEGKLGLPVIGFVSEIKNGGGKNKKENAGTVVANQPRSPVSESFRSLRTSLEFFNFESSLKSLIITSPVEEAGKSTIATNLAIVIAQSGKRVVLLDADLRRPNVHKLLNTTNRMGLSNMLRGQAGIKDVLQVSESIGNFHVITSGSLPPNPADLLGSTRMKKIVSYLEQTFDWVIIDTPPTIVTDAQILSTIADGAIFVVEPGKLRTNAVKASLEEFQRINANILGIVMNRIPRNKEYYYGGYHYYSQAYGDSKYHHTEGSDLKPDMVMANSNRAQPSK